MRSVVALARVTLGPDGTDRPPGAQGTGGKAQPTAGRDLLVLRAPGVGVHKEDQTRIRELAPN